MPHPLSTVRTSDSTLPPRRFPGGDRWGLPPPRFVGILESAGAGGKRGAAPAGAGTGISPTGLRCETQKPEWEGEEALTSFEGPIVVIGAGRLGRAWALELGEAGIGPLLLWGRRPAPGLAGFGPLEAAPVAGARVVLLCVQDDAIEGAAAALAANPSLGGATRILHGSGLKTSRSLAALGALGMPVGSVHPLQSFPTEPVLGRMRGVTFAVEGDEDAVTDGWALAEAAGGRPRRVTADQKPAYHAAAVVASNLLVAAVDAAVEAASLAGFEADDALRMLLPLVEGSVANLGAVGLPDALTGPIARGDVGVVSAHLDALAKRPALAGMYRALSARAVEVARRQGRAPEEALNAIRALIARQGAP